MSNGGGGGHAVEAARGREESVGGEEAEMGMEDEVVAEGVDGGDGFDVPAEGVLSIRKHLLASRY